MRRLLLFTLLLILGISLCSNIFAQVTVTLGEGTQANTTTGSPTPYGTYYKNFRQQYLVKATELNDIGGGPGNINSVGFFVQALNTCSPMPNFRVRVKATTQTALTSNFETGTYTEVFQVAEFMPIQGWNTHTFNAPFNWDGASNLLIDVVTDMIPGSYSQNASVNYTPTVFNSALRYESDYDPAIDGTSGTTSLFRANMQINMEALDITDLNALSVTGPTTPNVNSTVNYSVAVKNYSLTALSTYTVKLMQVGGVELGTVAGTTIQPLETLTFTLPWTPTVVGETQLYGKVVMTGDENPANDETDMLTVNVMEAGLLEVELGNGTTTNTNTSASPYGTFYKNFRQQYLYTADEIYAAGGAPGLINSLAFNVQSIDQCTAMPNYRIRLKHTEQTALTTAFEAGEYTQVWQAAEYMPTNDWNLHVFSNPFFWDGASNLLVDIITDLIPGSYARNALVYQTTTPFASSLRYQSDTTAADTATTGNVYSERANARFFLLVDDMGSLSGTVTSGGAPLADATIAVEGTVFTANSAADGTYTLPHVPVGSQTVIASKHGYADVSHIVTIVEDQATTQNFAMTLLPQVAVTGRIVGSDNPTVGIADATITLSGYEPYTATTNASGQFSIPNVFSGHTYSYTANAVGYAAATGTVEVGTTPVNMGDIIVNEVAYPPHGVVATESDDYSYVSLEWEAPVPGGSGFEDSFEEYADFSIEFGDWTLVDVDQSTTYGFVGISFPNSGSAMSYIIFNPNNTTPPLEDNPAVTGDKYAACFASTTPPNNDWMITPQVMGGGEVRFWARTYMPDYGLERFNVGVSTTGTDPADFTIISGTTYVEAPVEWTEYVYDLSAYAGQQIHVGIQCVSNDAFIFFVDDFYVGDALVRTASSAVHNNVDTPAIRNVNAGRSVVTPNPVNIVSPSIRNNTRALQGYSGPERGGLIALDTKTSFEQQNSDRAMEGYKVWRLLQGQESNEAQWTSLTPNPITATAHQDTQWNTLPDGIYKWAVKAVYTGGALSNSAFSNPVERLTQVGTIAGFVRNASDQPISGATVATGTYTVTTAANGAYSLIVPAGTHTVTASHPNYTAVTQPGVIVVTGQTTNLDFNLPASVLVLNDGFESYADFATTFAPWTLVDVDQSTTYGFSGISFPNSGTAMSYIIFNPTATTPPLEETPAHGGSKFAASFAAETAPNNDWMITPQVPGGGELKFWAKSFTANYGLERFKVGVSTTGTAPENFSIISAGNYVEAPVDWTEYTYDLAAYAEQQIYVGIQCVSNDAFIFFVDDVTITGPTSNEDGVAPVYTTQLIGNYPNPFNPETNIRFSLKEAAKVSIEIYNVKGQLVRKLVNDVRDAGDHVAVWNGTDNNGRAVSSGVYYFKMNTGKYSSTKKMILMK